MKKRIIFAAISAMVWVGYASPIMSDTFTYADGDLTTESSGVWTSHSGSANFIQVASGQAVLTHGGGSREDVNIKFGLKTFGSLYFGLDVSVDDLGAPFTSTDNEYFAHFRSDPNPYEFLARVDVVPSTGGGDYTLGIASFDSTADAVWATDLEYDTFYRLVVKYDIDNDRATLWVDPASSSDTSILGDDGTDQDRVADSFALRQSNSTEDETIRVDNLVVSRNFGDVAIPEPTTAALFFIGLAGLLVRRVRS